MEQGDLILAPKGEAIVNHYSFYSTFASGVDYSVIFGSVLIGTLPALFLPQLNDHFLLAARRWQVVSVDDDRKEITVRPAHGKKPPNFFGGGGEIHPRVRQMMRDVVLGDRQFRYLNATAARLLSDARETAIRVAIGAVAKVLLAQFDMHVYSYTMEIGTVAASKADDPLKAYELAEQSQVRCHDPIAGEKMIELIGHDYAERRIRF